MRVYVAASSAELERAAQAMDLVEGAGHELTHDWVSVVIERGDANPVDAPEGQRMAWAEADLEGVEEADVVWLLMPNTGGLGAFWECGYAHALGKRIVISGAVDRQRRTIFAAGHAGYETDAIAFRAEFEP
jgi:nucleoside 2-deoxyribosyltransferase